jgi:GxxExxY protein
MHADVAGVDRLSGMIIGCAFRVMNGLGAGFAEKVYENALAHELRKAGWRSCSSKRLLSITTVS